MNLGSGDFELLSLVEAARLVNLSEATLRGAIRRGELGAFRIAAALKVTRVQLESWLRRSELPVRES